MRNLQSHGGRWPVLRLSWRCLHGLVLAGVVATSAHANCARLVASGNPEYPPYLWRDAPDSAALVGANAELMRWLSREIGVPIDVRSVGTWARVQEEARQGRIDLIAGAFLTVPRLDYMDYVHPAFAQVRSVVWVRQANPIGYQRWPDLQGKNGLAVNGSSFGEEFDRFAKQSLRLVTVPTLEQALRMVERGRADFAISEEAPAQALIARRDIPGLAAEEGAVSHEGLFLTVPHRSECNTPELRAKLARAIYQLDRQQGMKRLVEEAVQTWRKRK